MWRERRTGEGTAHVFDRRHDPRSALCRRVLLESAEDWRIVATPVFVCRDCERRLGEIPAYRGEMACTKH